MKKEKQTQNQSVGRNVLIVVLILIILATSAFGIFAWARYQTTIQGESTAQVAKWNFKVTGDTTQTGQVAFPISRTDENTTVAEGTIAPGTYGEIPIEIDVTGTQTDLIYTIIGSMANLPRNLKLYSDSARTQEIGIEGQIFSRADYLKVADIGTETKIISEKIYWEWPFETGETAEDIKINNQEDTEDMGKPMTMALTVSGKQLNDAPALADLVQVGDYVNYDANSNGERTFSHADYATIFEANTPGASVPQDALSETISTANSFNADAKAQWRVLSVNRETKEIELMSVDPTAQKVKLSGINGYANAEEVLNNIGKIYDDGNGAKADSGRSITIGDIEKYSSFVKENFTNGTYAYGNSSEQPYTFKTPGNKEVDLSGDEMVKLTGSTTNPATVMQTYYKYNGLNYFSNSTIYNMIFKNITSVNDNKMSYWLASRCANIFTSSCYFAIRYVYNGSIDAHYYSYYTNGNVGGNMYGTVPVVSLQDNIQTTGKVNDVWQLKID